MSRSQTSTDISWLIFRFSHEWPGNLYGKHFPNQGHHSLSLSNDERHDRQHRRQNENVIQRGVTLSGTRWMINSCFGALFHSRKESNQRPAMKPDNVEQGLQHRHFQKVSQDFFGVTRPLREQSAGSIQTTSAQTKMEPTVQLNHLPRTCPSRYFPLNCPMRHKSRIAKRDDHTRWFTLLQCPD